MQDAHAVRPHAQARARPGADGVALLDHDEVDVGERQRVRHEHAHGAAADDDGFEFGHVESAAGWVERWGGGGFIYFVASHPASDRHTTW